MRVYQQDSSPTGESLKKGERCRPGRSWSLHVSGTPADRFSSCFNWDVARLWCSPTARSAGLRVEHTRYVCVVSQERRGEPRDPPAKASKGWSRADGRRSQALREEGAWCRAPSMLCDRLSLVPDTERCAHTDTWSSLHARARTTQQRHARGLLVGRHEHAQRLSKLKPPPPRPASLGCRET